jgi:predicted nuclease of predicted toxin-antitoxin system
VLFTHHLDFGTALALTHAGGPSVLQVRGRDVLPEDMGAAVVAALRQHDAALAAGALVVVDAKKLRVRLLPL